MNILYGLDNNFVPQTSTSMMYLCLNNKKNKKNIEFIEINNIEEHFNFKFDVTGCLRLHYQDF